MCVCVCVCVLVNIDVLWNITPCNLVRIYRRFGETSYMT